MAAVLSDALHVLATARRRALPFKRLQRELAWFASPDRSDPFAFESICDVLGFEASWIRRRLLPETMAANALLLSSGLRRRSRGVCSASS